MNYYEDLVAKIEDYIDKNQLDLARLLIEDELKQAYVPKDVLNKLNGFLIDIGPKETIIKQVSDEDIVNMLHSSSDKQLIAVDQLNKKNLRDYIEICNEYLLSEGYINAKVLLVDSLIRQEIGETITFNNKGLMYEFIPKYVLPIEESDGFKAGIAYLEGIYLKEPSKLKIARDLLFKEFMMLLPINQEKDEGITIAKKVFDYIEKAFA